MIPMKQRYDMTALYQELIEKGRSTIAFPLREYWLDIGRIADFEKAQRDFAEVFR